ncbi:MAG: polymer-forming cytoskeletal protein [Paludibacteraceae bacterium]|nr:polymer-forming cytoskeletal protein [Paludibacteraceae bacterium]
MAKDSSAGSEHNTLAFGTKVVGDIQAESDFRLDGSVEGTITCKGKVIIGTKGSLDGTLTCNNADILGRVNGQLHINDTLSLKSSAHIEGDIDTKILSIEPQAIFTGTCNMSKRESTNNK